MGEWAYKIWVSGLKQAEKSKVSQWLLYGCLAGHNLEA